MLVFVLVCITLGGGSVVVGLLFNVQPIVCRVSVFVFVLLYHYFVPILVLQSS